MDGRILWHNLRKGQPTVIVGAGSFDLIVEPVRCRGLTRLRNALLRQVTVVISFRRKELRTPQDGARLRVDIGRRAVERLAPTARPPHLATMIADGSVRPGSGARHTPKPVKPTGSGKTAAEHVSEGRR